MIFNNLLGCAAKIVNLFFLFLNKAFIEEKKFCILYTFGDQLTVDHMTDNQLRGKDCILMVTICSP